MSKRVVISLVCVFVCSVGGAQQGLPDAKEVERRNSAASFALGREMSLAVVHQECVDILKDSQPSMMEISKKWIERNHLDLETSVLWLNRYFEYLKTNAPELAKAESASFAKEQAGITSGAIELYFKKNVPNSQSCAWAAKTFEVPQLDIQNIPSNPGYEQFAEFPETLRKIRSDPGFAVHTLAEKRYDRFVAALSGQPRLAMLTAAEAAGSRGDERLRVAIYEKLAATGNARAAQTVALAHFQGGKQIPRNPQLAFLWFYQAWALAEPEGLNGLGVLLRDGQGVAKDVELAFAAFSLAKAAAKTKDAHERASNNIAGLDSTVSEASKRRTACLSLGALDETLERLLSQPRPLPLKRAIQSPGRRLGEISKELAPYMSAEPCTVKAS